MTDTRNTRWFAVYDGADLIAFSGLMVMGPAVRLKASWTVPEWRGRGVSNAILDRTIAEATELCPSVIDCFVYQTRIWLQRGFRQHGKPLPNGAIKMRKVL